MSWTRVFELSLLATLLILTVSSVGESAAVRDDSKSVEIKGITQPVFVPESDASNFFKRRSRRSTRYAEYQAEQRVKLAHTERWREYNEEQRDELEYYFEEVNDEHSERTRETNEQLREYNYDGIYPRFFWSH
ncbi:upper zone of growth plate and cartilage matrix associated a [Aulostomus maculatus]